MDLKGAGMLLVVALGLGGCGKAGPHAAGSGYGAGIPRVNFTFGNEPQTRGGSMEGVAAPSEAEPPAGPRSTPETRSRVRAGARTSTLSRRVPISSAARADGR